MERRGLGKVHPVLWFTPNLLALGKSAQLYLQKPWMSFVYMFKCVVVLKAFLERQNAF